MRARGTSEPESRSLPVYAAGAVEVPFVIAGMDEMVDRGTWWEPHSHPTHELLWNEHGASSVTVGSRTWTVTPALGLWIPAGVPHSGFTPAGTWYRATQFSIRALSPISDRPVTVEITALLRLLLDHLMNNDLRSDSRALAEAMVIDVLVPSARELIVQVPQSSLLRPIVDAVREDPGDSRSLAEWAGQLGVSARTVTRAFRTETGLGFAGWVATVRAAHAVVLLAQGHDVGEVAELVGYRSASAFGAAFRRVTGLTPGQFRAG